MTSMPASRRARAITFAPRSWPSSPGLATSTRIGGRMVRGGSFRVRAEDGPQRVADFAQRRVGADGVQQAGHGVPGSFGSALQRVQRLLHPDIIAPLSERGELFGLMPRAGLVDL